MAESTVINVGAGCSAPPQYLSTAITASHSFGSGAGGVVPMSSFAGSPAVNINSKHGSGILELSGEKADILVNGVSLSKQLLAINERLAILVPDPEKLEKYESLRLAYDNYKIVEQLLSDQCDQS